MGEEERKQGLLGYKEFIGVWEGITPSCSTHLGTLPSRVPWQPWDTQLALGEKDRQTDRVTGALASV